jgi:hypothetical protein
MEAVMTDRPLNYLELAHLNRVVIMAAEYTGDLDAAALETAFRLLCERHPVLRGRIEGVPPEVFLTVPGDHQPELLVLEDVPGVLSKIAELPWDATKGVADLVRVQGEGHGFVALRTDHSITDANAWLGLFRELLRLFTTVADGREPDRADDVGLPKPPAELFHQRLGLIPYDRRLFHSAAPPVSTEPAGLISGYLTLTEDETAWLRRSARRYRTTVHGLVAGAILLAQRVLAGGDDAVPMYCVSPVDFRPRVDPPVGELETTNFMMSYVAEVDVWPRMSPVLVAQAVKAQLDSLLAKGDGVRATERMTDQLGRNLSFALISNMGVIDEFPAPDGLSFHDIHILNTVGDTYFPGYYVSTYRGRLTVLYVLTNRFFGPEDAEQLTTELKEQLVIVGASA